MEIGPRGLSQLAAFGGIDQRIAVGLAAGLLQRQVDQVHAVVAADREEVGVALEFRPVGLHELIVQLRVVTIVVVARGDDADRDIAHAGKRMLVGDLGLAKDLDLLWINAAFGQRFAEGARLGAARDHDENSLRIEILGALHISREIRTLHRHAHELRRCPRPPP